VPTLVAKPLARAGVTFDTAGVSTGPAPPIRGARPGGTVHVLRTAPLATDPTRPVPASDRSALGLLFRTLTGYRSTADGLELVGDLAPRTTRTGTRCWARCSARRTTATCATGPSPTG